MKTGLTGLMIAAAVAGGVGLAAPMPAQAKTSATSEVKIGQWQVQRYLLHVRTYYQTTKKVTISAQFMPSYVEGGDISMHKVTLPKGTIIAGEKSAVTKHNKTTYQMYLYPSDLGYNVLKPNLSNGYTSTPSMRSWSKATSSFKKVSRPTYLPTYSYGDMYAGSTVSAIQSKQTKRIQITSNGYVEVHKKVAKAEPDSQLYQKPSAAAKIERTTVKGSTRYLYLNKKLSGFTTTKVKQNGKTRYRLAMKNLHTPIYIKGQYDDDIPGSFYSIYNLGGHKYFTYIGDDDTD
ncbi:hypothetical protein [Lactiplantibacillus daowaiensis]|uniref:Extracellular protein n=1 Tax=Lactiplantibacillus daowaiensis TaxID=2559918 RepID=A0ABW1RZE8_9LACO|nr:hypothetical protein [Lactiplantibacillus daowaiensis]